MFIKLYIASDIKLPEPIYKCNKNHSFLVSFIHVKNDLGVPCIQIGNLNLSGHIHLKILSKDSLYVFTAFTFADEDNKLYFCRKRALKKNLKIACLDFARYSETMLAGFYLFFQVVSKWLDKVPKVKVGKCLFLGCRTLKIIFKTIR